MATKIAMQGDREPEDSSPTNSETPSLSKAPLKPPRRQQRKTIPNWGTYNLITLVKQIALRLVFECIVTYACTHSVGRILKVA